VNSIYGVPYIPKECSISSYGRSDNIIIYGHHIKGGQMFSELDKYKEKSFYERHKYVEFDTLKECGIYEIIAVFTTTVYDDLGFKYYEYIDFINETEFNEYIDKCLTLSLYECSGFAEYKDKLLTLSTCEYSRKNSRLVIVARKL